MTKPLNLGSSWCVTTNLARNWWIIYVFDHLVWVEIVGKKIWGSKPTNIGRFTAHQVDKELTNKLADIYLGIIREH